MLGRPISDFTVLSYSSTSSDNHQLQQLLAAVSCSH